MTAKRTATANSASAGKPFNAVLCHGWDVSPKARDEALSEDCGVPVVADAAALPVAPVKVVERGLAVISWCGRAAVGVAGTGCACVAFPSTLLVESPGGAVGEGMTVGLVGVASLDSLDEG